MLQQKKLKLNHNQSHNIKEEQWNLQQKNRKSLHLKIIS